MAGGAAGSLAGCSQLSNTATTDTTETTGTDGTTEGTDTTTGVQQVDRPLQMPIRDQPSELNKNSHATNGGDGIDLLTAYIGDFSVVHKQYEYEDVEPDSVEVDVGADEFRMTFKEDVQWHVGGEVVAPLTAEDYRVQEELARRLVPEESRTFSPVEERRVEGPNDKTYVAKLKPGEYNDVDVKHTNVAINHVWVYRDGKLADKLEELEAATSSDAKDKVRNEVTKLKLPWESAPLSGIWKFRESGAGEVHLDLNTDHWAAKERDWNFDSLVLKYLGEWGKSQRKLYLAYTEGRLDLQHNFAKPGAVKFGDVPDRVDYLATPPDHGDCLIVNGRAPAENIWRWKDDPQETAEVTAKARQGLAFALDTEQARKNAFTNNPRFPSPGKPTGIGKTQSQNIFSEEFYSEFPEYGYDQERAARKFREAGCTKDGGTWYAPDGDPLTVKMTVLPWYNQLILTLIDDLESFGMTVERVSKGSTKLSQMFWGTKEYSTFIVNYGGVRPPSSSFVMNLNPPEGDDDRTGAPDTFLVPEGPPTLEGTGSWKEVDVAEFASRQDRTTESEMESWYEDVARVYAYNAIVVPILGRGFGTTFNTDTFEWPTHPEESPAVTTTEYPPSWAMNYPYRMLHRGHDGPPVARPK